MRYFIHNPNRQPVSLSSGEVIPPNSFLGRLVPGKDLPPLKADVTVFGLKLFLAGPEGLIQTPGDTAPSEKQREYYKVLTGQQPPAGITRVMLALEIDKALAEQMKAEEEAEPVTRSPEQPRLRARKQRSVKAPVPVAGPGLDVLSGRVYALDHLRFDPLRDLTRATMLVWLGDGPPDLQDMKPPITLMWDAPDSVDEWVLAGLIRLCSAAVRGQDQRVVIVGTHDSINTVSACILREYLGCDAKTAISMMRAAGMKGEMRPELLQTIENYRLT